MRGKFTVSIELGNDDVQTTQDVSRLLVEVANTVREMDGDFVASLEARGQVMDANGNSVGQWVLRRRQDG